MKIVRDSAVRQEPAQPQAVSPEENRFSIRPRQIALFFLWMLAFTLLARGTSALYLAERVDAIVLKIVEEVFEQIRDTPYSQVAENRIRQESNLQKTKRAAAEKKIKAAQHALERFEGEILKCLDGTSNFTEDMIAKQIRRYQQELDDAKAEYAELQNARLNEAAEIRKLRTYYDDFKGWAEEFDTAPLEMKRMILSHLIDRVEVGRKYQVIVKFNMKYRQFLECTAETYNTEIGA